MSVPYSFKRQVAGTAGPQSLLRTGKLKLVSLAQIVIDGVLQAIEDLRVHGVHAEEAKVHTVQQPGLLQVCLGIFRRRLLVDRRHLIHGGTLGDALAANRTEQVQQLGRRLLHRGDVVAVFFVDIQDLTGAPSALAAREDVVAKQEQERLTADEIARLIDGMAVPFGSLLDHERQSRSDLLDARRLQQGPILALELSELIGRERRKVLLLDNDLDRGLADAVAVHDGQHLFLYGGRRRIHPCPAPRRRHNRLAHLIHVASSLPNGYDLFFPIPNIIIAV